MIRENSLAPASPIPRNMKFAISMAPTVCRCPAIETLLESGAAVRGPNDLLAAIHDDVSPIDDIRSTARYREEVMSRVLYFALREACPGFR